VRASLIVGFAAARFRAMEVVTIALPQRTDEEDRQLCANIVSSSSTISGPKADLKRRRRRPEQ